MKKTITVNVDKVDEEYKNIVKEEMTRQEVGQLGVIIFKQKLSKLRNRWYRWKQKVRGK